MSVADKIGPVVARKADETADRLQQAALSLFRAKGYDRTTTAGIAAEAGVTERTFFRYFPDKREVLFHGQSAVLAVLTTTMADAPARLGPLDTLFRSFQAMLPHLESSRAWLEERHRVIAATPALQERETSKMATLSDALALALRTRGVSEVQAVMAARIGMTAFGYAVSSWLDDPSVGIAEHLERTHGDLRSLLADS